jgi:hypothetical protein
VNTEPLHSIGNRSTNQRGKVIEARVHAPVGEQADEMKCPAARSDLGDEAVPLIAEQQSLAENLVDLVHALRKDAPSAKRVVSHLRVTHVIASEADG